MSLKKILERIDYIEESHLINKQKEKNIKSKKKYEEKFQDITKKIRNQLINSYEIFGKDKYLDKFFISYEEVLKRYRHFDTICWAIFGGTLAASFTFLGYIISNINKIVLELQKLSNNLLKLPESIYSILIIILPFLLAFSISFLGFLSYMKVYEIARNTRKYIYLVEKIFGIYFLSYTEPFLEKDLIPNYDRFSRSFTGMGKVIFSIRWYLLIFEIVYFIIIVILIIIYLSKFLII